MYHSNFRPFEFSIFSHSLGDHSAHDLRSKLIAASSAGFSAVEISTIDLNHHHLSNQIQHSTILDSAREIGDLCESLGLRVACLQPLRDVVELGDTAISVEKATSMFPIMDALRTDLLLCCSSSLSPDSISADHNQAVKNLRAMGEAAKAYKNSPKRIAFEALSWGTFINTWAQAWKIVDAVNLENVGICLDSFNSLAREWADPTSESGVQVGAAERLIKSLSKIREIPGSKIFLLQIADGRRLPEPILEDTFEMPALMKWSRSSRLFPFESHLGAYLPVTEFIEAVIQAGYRGPLSLEVFNVSLFDHDPNVPTKHSARGFKSLMLSKEFCENSNRTESIIDDDIPAVTPLVSQLA